MRCQQTPPKLINLALQTAIIYIVILPKQSCLDSPGVLNHIIVPSIDMEFVPSSLLSPISAKLEQDLKDFDK